VHKCARRLLGKRERNEKREKQMKTISRDELKQKLDRKDNFLLVETLPATAYHHNHLPGAINLPPESVTSLASQILPDKNAEIVVYCASPT
jgi:rhodanese-related sulfurtransferase